MSKATIKDLSVKNDYRLPRHRSYELRHFCWQYPEWKKVYEFLQNVDSLPPNMDSLPHKKEPGKPTERVAIARTYYADRIRMVEETAESTSPEMAAYILKGVAYGHSYEELRTKFAIPCDRNTYYDLLRRFFWLLDKARG